MKSLIETALTLATIFCFMIFGTAVIAAGLIIKRKKK